MIIRTASGQDVEHRNGTWPSTSTLWPNPVAGWVSTSGLPVTVDSAFGVPAVASVIRQPSQLIASLPFITYRKGATRVRAENSLPWKLLHDSPNEETDSFEFFYDIALSLEATQNAFIQKTYFNGALNALIALNPQRMMAYRERDGERTYKYMDEAGAQHDINPKTLIHIRGFTPIPGSMNGVSYIHANRDAIGASQAMQRFEGDYFRNNAQAPLVFTGNANQQQAKDNAELWNNQHAGTGNQWKPGFLWGAIQAQALPLSNNDAQFVDTKRMSVEDACRIWSWPHHLMELSGSAPLPNEDQWTAQFMRVYVLWRLKRIERALAADPDLFAGKNLEGEFLTTAMERADFSTRVTALKNAIQGGIMTPNEAREYENLAPHPDGDQLQYPLVGGGAPVTSEGPAEKEPSMNGAAADRALEELLTTRREH